MPFKSKAQRRWMYSHYPEMAKRWEAHTPKGKRLPNKVRKRRKRTHNALVENVAAKAPSSPLAADPTRTATLRRVFLTEVRRRFARLRRKLVDLVLDEDVFGVRERSPNPFVGNASFSSTQVDIADPDILRIIERIQAGIDSQDVIELETEPHITVRYGLHTIDSRKVERAIEAVGPIRIKLGKLSLFKNEEQDVLKVEAESKQLRQLHERLGILPNTETFKEYVPHLTIAYLKSGTGEKYTQQFTGLEEREIILKSIVFSDTERNHTPIAVNLGNTDEYSRISDSLEATLDPGERDDYLNPEAVGGSATTEDDRIETSGATEARTSNARNESGTSPTERLATNQRWRFLTDAQKVQQFQQWLRQQINVDIIGVTQQELERAFWRGYVEEGYRKGAGRAFDDTRRVQKVLADVNRVSDFYEGTKDEFLRSAFGRPVAIEKVKLLTERVYTDLKGVTDAMATQMSRVLADGLVQGQNPRQIARTLTDRIDKIGQTRAETIARTETIRAHAEGQLDALEIMGVEEVGVMVEWSTAGDGRVCPLCESMSGAVFSIKEARGMIPRHANCRCAHIPANVGEGRRGQKRQAGSLAKARDESIRREVPGKKSLAEKKRESTWVGADKDFKKDRPKSILDTPKAKEKPTQPKVEPPKPAPEPKPIEPPKPKTLEERLAGTDRLNNVQREVAELGVKSREAISRLEAEQKELFNRYAETVRRNESAKEVMAERIRVDKELVDARFKGRIAARKSLNVPVDERIELEVTSSKEGEFGSKVSQARAYVEQVVGKQAGRSRIEVSAHPLPSGSRAFHRSGYTTDAGIYCTEQDALKTYIHELGHRLEDEIPDARRLAQEFRDMRIARAGTPDVKMINVGVGYGPDEIGNEDEFWKAFDFEDAHYVGKKYASGSTEVISMGIEKLYHDPTGFAEQDPEYFKFIVGLLQGDL